ncbi:hypothetical protein CON65_12605 [Bacillus pseudomycoides]|uniref:Uncharacterized protein n=1 Tax=Bacillus pseudomycoides TaxID=64104 RepID=A0AA91VBW8_9BACI|nr:hypothetical protein [Bacillus pseudomycoides]PED82318.1 hypothetical protein CON65_12605 [Bacillus pseudomycoides]
MDKGLTFLTLALALLWLVFDDLFGEKKFLSKVATALTPNLPSMGDMAAGALNNAQNLTRPAEQQVGDMMHDMGKKIAEKNGDKGTADVLDKMKEKREQEKKDQEKKKQEKKSYLELPDGWGLKGKQIDFNNYIKMK